MTIHSLCLQQDEKAGPAPEGRASASVRIALQNLCAKLKQPSPLMGEGKGVGEIIRGYPLITLFLPSPLSPPTSDCVAILGDSVFCHFDRREKS
jgi:hypothetical protein